MTAPTEHWALRNAELGDADELAALHRAAILRSGPTAYGITQIRAWVKPINAEVYRQIIEHARVRVALDDGAICGFATTSLDDELIRAVYVAPFAIGRGVGSALLADAETGLQAIGRNHATLEATRNSVDFFRWSGYIDVRESQRRLAGGVALACVLMEKELH